MTGRELIIYILENHLEDEEVFNNGSFVGFLTIEEAADKANVGVATIKTLINMGKLKHIRIGNLYFIADNEIVRKE